MLFTTPSLIGTTSDPTTRVFLSRSIFTPMQPPTVRRFVVAIVINAIDLKFLTRTLAHVFKKVLKIVPTFAHHNATATVVEIRSVTRIVAARTHTVPRPVCRRVSPPVFIRRGSFSRVRRELCASLGRVWHSFAWWREFGVVSGYELRASFATHVNIRQCATTTSAWQRSWIESHDHIIGFDWTPGQGGLNHS